MIDLTRATNCITVQKQYGTYRGAKVGRIAEDCDGMLGGYREGQIVLFREELHPSDFQMRMGEYMGMEQQPIGRVTIESPLTQEEIEKQRAKGSLLTTIGTMVGVPKGYVEEIRI